jgi:hypothetical protein
MQESMKTQESVGSAGDQRFTRARDRLDFIVGGEGPKAIGLTNNSTCIYLDISTFEHVLMWAEIGQAIEQMDEVTPQRRDYS